ncbi:MAG: hypothetical protein J6U58_06855 [Bacteroidaceae bacterium]|nr:hypothetical protein [Bacteroidaceae bacterium]
MNTTKYISLIFALLATMLISCGEDRTGEYLEMTQENQWIYSTMKDVYLWGEEIKQPEHSQFFSNTSKFFSSLLNKNDKVSYFTDTIKNESYGILATFMRDPIAEQPSKVYALTLFVEPGSPADIAGVKRGTWISGVDGKELTISNTNILISGNAIKLTTEKIDYNDEEMRYFWEQSDTLNMGNATEITNHNILFDTIYSIRDKKAGYILCNSFNGEDFIEKTENILLKFATEEVTDIVLDLRYNNGGSIANAATFAGALVPTTLHGTPFATLKKSEEIEDTIYNYMSSKANLCDKRICIITGSRTCGVAELFINSLNSSRNMYDVLTFGINTKGDNVIVGTFNSPYGFAINPAIAFMHSASGSILSSEGVVADYPINELEQIEHIQPLGKEQEHLLYSTLHFIATDMIPQ